ncbi:MAG: LytTR family transcriptional regulator DNA-binding domain-containing protein, partial [Saprospiraceae bacterium]|nr:LytTR family transcriptional regulator DNA-binding domain-containing protein [Saprospiraceae bacterium]
EDQRPLLLRSLNYLEERLQPDLFFRVNRQQLVNVRFIAGVDNALGGQLRLHLQTGETVEVSRRQALKLRETLRI